MTAPLEERHIPRNVNLEHKRLLSFQERLAVVITSAIGTMYAVYLFVAITLGWMLWQALMTQPFDPYPFAFLLFLSNVVQLFLMPLIMVGQNIQGRHSELRAEEEFKATLGLSKDMNKILKELEELREEVKKRRS